MLQAGFDFDPAILPSGKGLTANLLLRFRTETPESPRRDLNLSLVIDRSGSMAGSPLQHALRAAEATVDQLEESDRLSVVVYDDNVNTVVPPQAVADKSAIKAAIRRVRAGGITNLSGGWLQGCEHIKANLDPQRINRVLLLTDGHANMGIRDPRVLTATAEQKAEEGVTTTTLGFAQGFNEDLLIGMARAAQGNFYFIQSVDDASEVFGIELDSLRAVSGQNLTVTLELAAGVTLVDSLSSATAETVDASTVKLTLGDLYEAEDKLLGLRLAIADAPLGQQPILTVRYEADVVNNGVIERISGSQAVVATVGTIEESALSASSSIILELSHLTIAKAKDDALTLAEQGQRTEAEALLRELIKTLRDQGLDETFEIAEEIEQLDYFAGRIAQGGLGNSGRKEMRDQSYQSLSRNRTELLARGVTAGSEVYGMQTVPEVGSGVELRCVREGGKLRVKIASEGYDETKNVQFPRVLRAEGASYRVAELELSSNGSFYRAKGEISRLAKPGEADQFAMAQPRSRPASSGKASRGPASAADLPTTDSAGDGVLVQCVKEGRKLRARAISDGYEPDWNMRFPRSVREEGMLYVVDEIKTAPDGKSYIACGQIQRLVQQAIAS